MPETGRPPIIPRQPGAIYEQGISEDQEQLIGSAISKWSGIEQAMEEVIWALLRLSVEEGRVITSPLDAKFKLNLLRGFGKNASIPIHLNPLQH